MMIETEANNIIFTCDSCGYAQLFEKKKLFILSST